MSEQLTLTHLNAHYGQTQVLSDLSISIGAGELVSLLGASGCGKTTTLRAIAGFVQPTSGSIKLGEQELTKLPPYKRDIGLVFQNYALFPHLTVMDNVGFGLKQRGASAEERRRRSEKMLERVGLSVLRDRYPAALSGGQKQRVALARALVIEPSLLMFDEPLSNLDARLRIDMRVEIRELQRANNATAVYVTHDQEEAFSISDRVAIMNAGRIEQYDRPEVLYRAPANSFVARFVGFENLIPMKVASRGADATEVIIGAGEKLSLSVQDFPRLPDDFVLATRPEGLLVTGDPNAKGIPARVGLRTYLGRAYQYKCETPAGPVIANGPLHEPIMAESGATLVPLAQQCCVLKPER